MADRLAALRTIPGVRTALKARFDRTFFTERGIGCLSGSYPSFAAATAAAAGTLPVGYDLDAAGAMYQDRMQRVLLKDYPALYWLSQVMADVRRVFDIGGHVGIMYHAYRRYLTFRDDLVWTVCDVPAVVRQGEELARRLGACQLAFTTSLDDATGCDLLLATGALQYIERPIDELLGVLRAKPQHVLINETPTHDTRSIITLQNIGISICPYRIAHRSALTAAVEAQGYTVVDAWEDPSRRTAIPYVTGEREIAYSGFCFRRT